MKLDPRIRFYLQHEQQILEWARMANEVIREANSFFSSLADSYQEIILALGIDAVTYTSLDEPYPKLFIIGQEWNESNEHPSLAFGIEWNKNNADFRKAYMGIWVNLETPRGRDLSNKIGESVKQTFGTRRYGISSWWPAQRSIQPSRQDYWDYLAELRQEIISSIQERWKDLNPIIERVLEGK